MRILVVAATLAEIEPLLAQAAAAPDGPHPLPRSPIRRCCLNGRAVDVLTTGVGMVATAAWCSRTLASGGYDVALNLGVCGTFRRSLAPGDVVHVVTDRMPELGAEDGDRFLTLEDLGLLRRDEFPFQDGRLVNASWPRAAALGRLPRVDGITVNTVHGHEPSIARVVERHEPHVETMEGAAFMFACLLQGIPFAQVRAVSNVVERRNRAAWRMQDAVRALNETAAAILEEL